MKKIVLLLLFLGVVYFGYDFAYGKPAAYRAYKSFATAVNTKDYPTAKRHATQEVVDRVVKGRGKVDVLSPFFRGKIHNIFYTKESETARGGAVEVAAVQTITYRGEDELAAVATAFVKFRHKATLSKGSEGWRVAAFESERIDLGRLR